MSGPLLTFLKYIFLALLYLFFFRVLRTVWVEVREPRAGRIPDGPVPPAPVPVAERVGRLAVIAPSERAGRVFNLGQELTVGRAPGCGVSLPDDTFVSQVHARVFRQEGEYFVEDLGSTNGTLLNDHKVTAPVAVRPGDRLQVGKTVMELDR
jgi:pSer/pThr/pTyr-binding forkhead associated (FHA) protein